jgi:methyl-accepting chemotaxis protein
VEFNNIKIGQRLGITFGVITLLTLTLLSVSYLAINKLSGNWGQYQKETLEKYTAAFNGKADLGDGIHMFKDYLLRGKDNYLNTFMADMAAIDKDAENYAANHGDMDDREKAALQSIKDSTEAYRTAMKTVVSMKTSGVTIEEIDKSVKGADRPLGKAFDDLLAIAKEEENATSQSIYSTVASSKQQTVVIGVLAALLSALFAWMSTVSITRPLKNAVSMASAVAKGDLTQRIDVTGKDEVGELLQALKDMNESLVGIVANVRDTTDTISTASNEIASGNADLSSRTEQQASSLEETASSMEELTSTVKQNAENAKQANQLATNASNIAVKGGDVVGEVVDTMASISTSSKKIVDIISVIEGIAFQTNILALNAAVEAARAGEQGRGFAVVAGEVRNLAQRSAAAAKEIKDLIDDSVGKVEAGSKQVDQAGATMDEIVQAVKRVTDIMSEIAAASNEQSAGIEQVNQAITQMDEVTQQNAALVEEAAAAAISMQDQSFALMHAVSIFKLEVDRAAKLEVAAKPVIGEQAAKRQQTLHVVEAPSMNGRKLSGKTKLVANAKHQVYDESWSEF